MPIQVVKDPQTGEERRVYVAPEGMGSEPTQAKPKAQPTLAQQAQQNFGPGILQTLFQSGGQALQGGIQEYQRSGDLGKAFAAAQQASAQAMEGPGAGRTTVRVVASAGRNMLQEASDLLTADIPAAFGDRAIKPTTKERPDAPFLGFLPVLPKLKSSGPAEDLITGLVQAGIEWIPAARAVGLAGKGLRALPGAAKVAQAATAATKAAGATKVAQAAAKIPGATVVGKSIAGNVIGKGAATGALIDFAGFDQHGGRLTDLIGQATQGTALEGIALDYLKSNPNDIGLEGRLKNVMEGALFGTALEAAFRTMRAARNYNWWRRAPEAEKPAATAALKQATEDLETEVAKQAYTTATEAPIPPVPGAAVAPNANLQPPTLGQVVEADPNAIAVDPKRFQIKAAGRKAEGGVAEPIADPAGYDPLKADVISVWRDPADGVTYVVNGHSRLAEAKASGYDRVLVRYLDAATADEARAAGALQNIQEGTIAAKDAGKFVQQTGRTPEVLAAEGINLANPVVAKQVETSAPAVAPTAKGELPDTRGQGQFFHGTAAEIKKLDEGYYENANIYGQGFYVTDDLKTAGSYTKKNAKAIAKEGGTPGQVIYRVAEAQPVNFYDLDAPVAPSVRQYLEQASEWSESAGRALDEADANPNISLAKLMDEIRGNSRSAGESRDTIQEVFDGIRETLQNEGYGGFTHVGGKLTKTGREHQVRIYWDAPNQIELQKYEPTAAAPEPIAVPAAAPVSGPSAAEIADLDRTLAQARADLTPQQRVAVRNQILQQKYEPPAAAAPEPTTAGAGGEPPSPPVEPPTVVEAPVPDENWARQLVQQMDQQRQGLEDGTITFDDLLENNVQKIQSPSGRTAYVPNAPVDAVQAYRAFSDVFTRPEATGIPVMSFEKVAKDTETWLNKNNWQGQAVLTNLKQLSGPLSNYQENLVALRAAQLYTDHSNLQAGIAANKWLNAAADEAADMNQLTAELLTAAANQKAANIALESVTRPIGQLLYSLQGPRPTPGTLPFDEAMPPAKNIVGELEQALEVEAQVPVSESIGKALSPEAEEAILTGNYTPQVLAEVDALARNMAQGAVTPGFASGFWKQVNDSVAIGARGMIIYRASQLLSSGLTLWSNTINNAVRLVQLPASQALGAGIELDMNRMSQSLMIYGQYVHNLQNAFRLATESFKAGRGLYDLDETSVDFLDKLAKQDLQESLLPGAVDRKAEWDLNTMPWLDVQDKSVWAIAQKRIWQALNLSTRTQVSLDTFFKVLAGQSFEYVRNLQPGLDRAVQQGFQPGSQEAWQFARDYAQAAVNRATRDIVIDGRTILDAVMESPQAQTAMRYATFTDDIWAQMEPKTMQRGMELAQAKGLEGDAANEYVRKYLEEASDIPLFARTFSMMPAAWQKLIDFSPMFSIIQPFNRTPGDLVKSAARMGGVTAPFVDTWWRDINSPDAFTRQRAKGDVAVGMAAISLGTIAMTQGRLEFTGGGPQEPMAKRKWRDEGKQPYSFRVRLGTDENGNPTYSDWVSMRVFEPFSTLFGAMADYQEIANKLPKEARERLGSALGMDLVSAVASGQLSKTYYQGFSELYEAAMGVGELDVGPNKRNPMERYISRLIASFVPGSSALRAGRRIEDPVVREVPPSQVEGGLLGLPMRLFQETMSEIRNMIPGWSETLPPRLNWITGEPIVLSGILGDQFLPPDQPWMATLAQFVPWSPLQVAPKVDPVMAEMARLHGKGANFGAPKNTDFGKELRLDPVTFNEYVMATANARDSFGRTLHQALTDLINSDFYKSLPQEEVSTTQLSQRAAAIDLEVQKFRQYGKEAFLSNKPELQRNLQTVEGLNRDVQYRLKYGQPIDVQTFTEQLR